MRLVAGDRGEHVREVPRGNGLDPASPQELMRGLLAERAALALDGDPRGRGRAMMRMICPPDTGTVKKPDPVSQSYHIALSLFALQTRSAR